MGPQNYIVYQYEIGPRLEQYAAKQSTAEHDFSIAVGQLTYLGNLARDQNLEGRTVNDGDAAAASSAAVRDDVCLICHDVKTGEVTMLPCGHSFWSVAYHCCVPSTS